MELWPEAAQDQFGIGKTASHRHLRIANGLTLESVRALSGTEWARNQKALLELVGVKVEEQAKVVGILLDEDVAAASMREAIAMAAGAEPPAQADQDEAWFRKASSIFTAQKRLRRRFFTEALMTDFEVIREAAEESGFQLQPIKGWKG